MKLFATDKAIAEAITRVGKEGQAWQNLVHRVAFSILKRGVDTRDFTKPVQQFNELVEQMPGASRANALRDWITAFTPCQYNEESKSFEYHNMKGFTPELVMAKSEPFWEFKKEEEYKPINPIAVIQSAVKRMEKDRATLGKKSKVTQEQIDALTKLLPAEEAKQ